MIGLTVRNVVLCRPIEGAGWVRGVHGTVPIQIPLSGTGTVLHARAAACSPGGLIAKVGFCRKPAFYLPVAGSRAPEMAL